MHHFKHNLNIDTDTIAEKILSLRPIWESRSNDFPFYTLGKSAYLDGNTIEYHEESVWMNELLYRNFSGLYYTVLECLSVELGKELCLTQDLALPGFHIFPTDEKFINSESIIAGKWHTDYPHKTLGLGDVGASAFTVAIELPSVGGGMDYLDTRGNIVHLPYKEKDLVFHSGLTPHRISGLTEYCPCEYRITLQGHVIKRNNNMEVFW